MRVEFVVVKYSLHQAIVINDVFDEGTVELNSADTRLLQRGFESKLSESFQKLDTLS